MGSYQADVQAVQYLLVELARLARLAANHKVVMTVDTQTVAGTFHLEDYNLYQQYSGVKNVVARLSSGRLGQERRSPPAVLVNCHYDSVPQSPGASDDAVSCGVMLETIRVLVTNNKTVLTNDLIFLFNGAEESVLLAAHGFITQHSWASQVRAFINLEAAGSGWWRVGVGNFYLELSSPCSGF